MNCVAQNKIVENPIFDRTSNISLRVVKVVCGEDTTFVHCEYSAVPQSWANISDRTYLANEYTGEHLTLLRCEGLPFSPDKRHFANSEKIEVVFCFPSITSDSFSFIEGDEDDGFNIHGIHLNESYFNEFSESDYNRYVNMASFYTESNNIGKAIEYKLKELEASNYLYGMKSEMSSTACLQLAILYDDYGDYGKAIMYGKEALQSSSELYGIINKELPVYVGSLRCLAGFLKNAGRYSEAVDCYSKSADLYKEMFGIDYDEYSATLHLLSATYNECDSLDKAIEIMNETVELQMKNLGIEHSNTLMSLNNLAGYLSKKGEYVKAIEIASKIVEAEERKGDKEALALFYNNLAGYYAKLNDYENAIRNGDKAVYIRKIIYGEESIEYASSLSNLAMYYLNSPTGSKDKAEEACLKALSIKRLLFGPMHIQNTSTMSVLADIYAHEGRYYDAIEVSKEALAIIDNEKGTNCNEYAITLSNISLYYSDLNDMNNAIEKGKEVCIIYKNLFGDENVIYAENLAYLANTYAKFRQFEKALECMEQGLKILQKNCIDQLESTDETWRSLFWSKYSSFFDLSYPYIVANCKTNSSVANLYNMRLFTKGLLYYQSNQSSYDITWQDVRNNLGQDDMAIEFVTSSNYTKGDSLNASFYALCITKDQPFPKMKKLFGLNTIIGKIDDYLSLLDNIGNRLWGELHEEIAGKNNIYFSASNFLNSINIEDLFVDGIGNISDKYNIYRLTSTKEIVLKRSGSNSKNAVLFGGLNYDEKDCSTTNSKEASYKRSGYDFLYNSKIEIDTLASILTRSGYVCESYSGTNGTEDIFKNLSSRNCQILHIATHGANMDIGNNTELYLQGHKALSDDSKQGNQYEKSGLVRSYLVLSGGNLLLRREQPISGDDGILTSEEISKLDLKSVDLVVLSACETGQGEYGVDDSMLGLQRGFKYAGVNTIIMSMRDIDDKATQLLMVEFYKNLMAGKSKYQSLKNAKKYLRQVENGKYDKPEYWASFIMLDGLN